MKKTIVTFGMAFAVSVLVATMPAKAEAAATLCDGGIEFIDLGQGGTNTVLQFGCRAANGTVTPMYAYTNAGSCTQFNVSLDTVKTWVSMVSSWALAGRKVLVYHDACGAENRVTTVSLRRQ